MPGVSRLITAASKQFPRYSEADAIELTDGRLLLAVGRKNGADDFAPGVIIGLFSTDGGRTWDDQPVEIQGPFDDVGDVMSVSLFRTKRGVHMLFLGRGPKAEVDTRVYQIVSSDEGKTWGKPQPVSGRMGYHVVNNAHVVKTPTGRLIVPAAFFDDVSAPPKVRECFGVYCMLSDDDGQTWQPSGEIVLENEPLMEPGVACCADGSIYMTIRTKLGVLYEARSRDNGATWTDFGPSKLPSPAAPSTVFRDPGSDDLWMFWINRPGGKWSQRTRLSVARSADHGRTWGTPRDLENDPKRGFGYVSVTVVKADVLLTYYEWVEQAGPNLNVRQRTIPINWFREKPVPPVFRTGAPKVLGEEGKVVSANSGLLVEKDRWRLWYTHGELGPKGEKHRLFYAESRDQGVTWERSAEAVTQAYHASVHRDGPAIVLYAWRRDEGRTSGLFRHVSDDDGKTFAVDPETPLIAAWWSKDDEKAKVGEGRVSNDAFDLIVNGQGTLEYFAACLEKATDPRTIVKHDNIPGYQRLIGRASSGDGVAFSPVEVLIRPDFASGDSFDTQFYGMQVFRYRGFYLGLLHTYFAESQVIQPEWAWSHDGQSWNRTRVPCISLGDEGSFDSRMIVFGAITMTDKEVVWLYCGMDWRHNAFKRGAVTTAIGRATLARAELDAWLDSLPQP